jgi:hypothetical protein
MRDESRHALLRFCQVQRLGDDGDFAMANLDQVASRLIC